MHPSIESYVRYLFQKYSITKEELENPNFFQNFLDLYFKSHSDYEYYDFCLEYNQKRNFTKEEIKEYRTYIAHSFFLTDTDHPILNDESWLYYFDLYVHFSTNVNDYLKLMET